jgi:acyl carrier protein
MTTLDGFMSYFNTWLAAELDIPTQDVLPDTQILEIGVLDSLKIMELIASMEERYQISVPLEDVIEENFATPTAIWSMVDAQLGARA